MEDGRLFALPVVCSEIDDIVVPIPGQATAEDRVFPTKIDAADLRPVPRDRDRLNDDVVLEHGEDQAASERRNAEGAGFALMRRIAVDDLLALLGGIVQRVGDRHGDLRAIGRFFEEEASDDTTDMPLSGVKVTMIGPCVALVRVMPS